MSTIPVVSGISSRLTESLLARDQSLRSLWESSIGRRWLQSESAVVRYGRRVGYAFYIAHQPIIVAVAYVVVQTTLPLSAEFALTLTVSLLLTVACVETLRAVVAHSRSLIALVRHEQPPVRIRWIRGGV
jgi:peptidoglycan/LPS O-acetylase OafA/YrhL